MLVKIINYNYLKNLATFSLIFLSLLYPKLALSSQTAISVQMWDGLDKNGLKIVKDVAILIDNKNYEQAIKRSENMKSSNKHLYKALLNIALWSKYKNIDSDNIKNIEFENIVKFAANNSYFPEINIINNNIENLIIEKKLDESIYQEYILKNQPKNKELKIHLLKSKINSMDQEKNNIIYKSKLFQEIKTLVADIWENHDFTIKEQGDFINKYSGQLNEENHITRINKLLWDSRIDSAKNIMHLINKDHQKLFKAIIEINKNPKHIDDILFSVPRKLRGSEHLQYKKAVFYHKKNNVKKTIKLLLAIPEQTKYPKKWWKLRHIYGRESLKSKKYKNAYNIIKNHGLNNESNEFTEANWLAGWISLRFLDNPKQAINHFKTLYANVSYPISVSRAAYWLGMSFEKLNDSKKAIHWYKIATQYPTYFYGQLAIHKYRSLIDNISFNLFFLPKEPRILDNDVKIISYKMALRSAYLLMLMNDKEDALIMIKEIIKSLNSQGKIGAIIKLVEEVGGEEMAHKVYRFSNRKNIFFIKKQFKIIDKIKDSPNSSLIHALIKQESGFARGAVSSAGAIGFMQIIPETAQQTARKLKIKYSSRRLKNDIDYNIRIGSKYIQDLLTRFNDSKILAISSYNAGPNSTKRWIKEFYDPSIYSNADDYKDNNIDMVIDWIELVTYGETRNYIQRVIENILVYNYLTSQHM